MTALEAALAALTPRADRLDRERLMFLAGRASVLGEKAVEGATAGLSGSGRDSTAGQASRGTQHSRWPWPAAFAAMTAVAAGLLVALVTRPGPQVVERIAPVRPGSQAAKSAPADHRPAAPAGSDKPVEGGEEFRSTPRWPWDTLALDRSDGRDGRLARAGLSRADYARLLESASDRRAEAFLAPASADKIPQTPPPPVSNREFLDSLLKETGLDRMERQS